LVALVASIPRDKSYGTVRAAGLEKELAAAAPFVLDVRESEEVARDGHIGGSVNIPLRGLMAKLDRLPAQDRPIVVYCGSSHRGAIAMAALRLLGYTDVRNLAFGFETWWKAGLPLAEGSPRPEPAVGTAPVVESQPLYTLLAELLAHLPADFHATTAGALHADLAARKSLFLLDVRRSDQYEEEGHIGRAVNVPFEVLFGSLDRLPPKDTPITVYCGSGHRSSVAVIGLRLLGYRRTTNLEGGLTAWMAAGLPLAAAEPRTR
jgi:rhodanese-related sulfurtransferase